MSEWHKVEFAEHEVDYLDACDLCSAPSRSAKWLFNKYGLPVVRCLRCRFMYVNPRLRQDILWQRYSQDFFQNEYLPQHGVYDAQRNYRIQEPYLRELSRYAPARGRLFEFGTAIGLFLAAARLDGWEVMGNELSEFAADYAGKHFDIPVIPGNAENIHLPPGSFDAVAMWETIEHVQSPRAVISKAGELLRHGGVLALSTPNVGGITFRLLRDKWWIIAPKEHIFYFTPQTITRLLNDVGFEVKKIWTADLDLYYLRHTVMGRTVMPAHIRMAWQGPADAADGSTRPTIFRQLATAAWGGMRPAIERLIVPAINRMKWADGLFVYAVRR